MFNSSDDPLNSAVNGGNARLGPNSVLGLYTLVEPLGRGGMGQVWKASDGKRSVALKLLPADFRGNAAAVAQVEETFQLVHALTHEHIGKILGLYNDPLAGPYVVMDFIPGVTLSEYQRTGGFPQKRLPLERVVEILGPVARALDYAHQKVIRLPSGEKRTGVLHRDVKPHNILVALHEGDIREVTLIDFGLAAEIRSTLTRHTNATVDTRGTRPYMSPEQIRGKRHQWDGRTDQYALAVVAYELLAGHVPFDGDDDLALMLAISQEPPDPIPGVPEHVNAAILKGLAKTRDERFESCVDFVERLSSSGTATPVSCEPPVRLEPVKPRILTDRATEWPSIAGTMTTANKGDTIRLKTRILTVPSAEWPSIADAMATANQGETIRLKPGRYRETIELREGVTLEGEDAEACVVELVPGAKFSLLAQELTSGNVSNLTFDGSAVTTTASDSPNAKHHGMVIQNSVITVHRCQIHHYGGSGIVVGGDRSQPLLSSNTCEDNRQIGIYFADGAQGVAKNNTCRENGAFGIAVLNPETCPELNANTCDENQFYGICFGEGAKGTAKNNCCRKNLSGGIAVIGPETCSELTANTCDENQLCGICFGEGAQGAAKNNYCRKNLAGGIAVFGPATSPELIGNTLEENQTHGILFLEGAAGIAKNNICRKNLPSGIGVFGPATSPQLIDNVCNGNGNNQVITDCAPSVSTVTPTATMMVSTTTSPVKSVVVKPRGEPPQAPQRQISRDSFAGTNAGELKVLRVGNVEFPLVWCPAGSFTMGSPATETGRSHDENQVQVTLTQGFWLGQTQLTQAQYQVVMVSNPSCFKGSKRPVESASWDDARRYCQELTALLDRDGQLAAGWSMRLPTEAQWEYACRARTRTKYSCGDVETKLSRYAWFEGSNGTHVVGQKRANPWGLYDMHGNVWEWCSDWYDSKLAGGRDPMGPSSGSSRVYRGGGWRGVASYCRSADRGRDSPSYRDFNLGFRVACVPSSR